MRALDEASRQTGSRLWLERRCFEVIGAHVPLVEPAAVKIALAKQSHHHAWHAQLWAERLPVLAGTDLEALIAPASPGLARLMDELAAPVDGHNGRHGQDGDQPAADAIGTDRTIVALTGLYRVLVPRKITSYRAQLAEAGQVSEGASIRALQLILADEVSDWQEGESLLQSLLDDTDSIRTSGALQVRLESLLLN